MLLAAVMRDRFQAEAGERRRLAAQLGCELGTVSCMDGRIEFRSMGLPVGLKTFRKAGGRVSIASESYLERVLGWMRVTPQTPKLILNLLHRSTHDDHKGCAYWHSRGGHEVATLHAMREAHNHELAFGPDLRMAVLCQITDSGAYEICVPGTNAWYVVPRYFNAWDQHTRIRVFGHAGIVSPDQTYREFVDWAFGHWPERFRHALAVVLERHNQGFDPHNIPSLHGCDHKEDCVVVGRRLDAYAASPQNFIVGTLGGSADQVETAGKLIARMYDDPRRVICRDHHDRILIMVQAMYDGPGNLHDPGVNDGDYIRAQVVAKLMASKYFDAFMGRTNHRNSSLLHLLPRLQVATVIVDKDYNYRVDKVWSAEHLAGQSLR